MVLRMIIGIFIILSIASLFDDADAIQFQSAKPTFFWQIQNFVEDIRLTFASGEDKSALAKEFADNLQTKQDILFANGKQIPIAYEQRRIVLMNTATSQVQDEGILFKIKRELQTVSELNEIRILYSEFQNCLEACTEQEKRDYNLRVNSLDTWKSKCSGSFNIDNFQNTDASYNRLALENCPTLNDYPKLEINRIFYGS